MSENQLAVEQVTQFLDNIQDVLTVDPSATPNIYYHNGSYHLMVNPDERLATKLELIVSTDKLKDLIRVYNEGLKAQKTSIVFSVVAELLEILTSHEKNIQTIMRERWKEQDNDNNREE